MGCGEFNADETPEYLRGPGCEGLPDDLAAIAEASETRPLKHNERNRLRRGIAAAKRRVNAARAKRDGKA